VWRGGLGNYWGAFDRSIHLSRLRWIAPCGSVGSPCLARRTNGDALCLSPSPSFTQYLTSLEGPPKFPQNAADYTGNYTASFQLLAAPTPPIYANYVGASSGEGSWRIGGGAWGLVLEAVSDESRRTCGLCLW
jgi:hypothetical protein